MHNMHSRNTGATFSTFAPAFLGALLMIGCAHQPIGPEMEPPRVARELGLAECKVSAPMRRYQVLDFADLLGNPDLADSPEWATAISMMQPGDNLRRVYCNNNGDNFFGLFRGKSVLFKFGSMIND